MMIQYSVGANFVLFVTNWLLNSIVEMWTVKTWLRLPLRLGLRLVMTLQFMTVQIVTV